MRLSNIRLDLVNGKKGLIGFISCTIDNRLRINSIAIYRLKHRPGYRLVYPRDKRGHLYYFPISRKLNKKLETDILKWLGATRD